MNDRAALGLYATQRDPDAFRYLVQAYQRMVYSACSRCLNDRADVEDAVQETFLRLARHAGDIRSHLATWLYTCATHVALDKVRRNHARRRHELAWAEQPSSADDRTHWLALQNELDETISSLDPEDRDLIVEHYLLGRSMADVAVAMGVSRTTVFRRTREAVARLRAALRARGIDAPALSITSFVAAHQATIQIPAALTETLMKVGLAGVGSAAVGTGLTVGAAVVGKSKLVAGLIAATLLTGGVATVVVTHFLRPSVTATYHALTAPAGTAALAADIAQRVTDGIAAQHYPFIDDARLATIRADFTRFVTAHTRHPLSTGERQRLLASVSNYLPRYLAPRSPDEAYLELPDILLTLQAKLYLALSAPPRTGPERAAREEQRQWLLDYVHDLPEPPFSRALPGWSFLARPPLPSRLDTIDGMDDGAPPASQPGRRHWPWRHLTRQEQIAAALDDPLSPLAVPLSPAQFDALQHAAQARRRMLGMDPTYVLAWEAFRTLDRAALARAVGGGNSRTASGSIDSRTGPRFNMAFDVNAAHRGRLVNLQINGRMAWGLQVIPALSMVSRQPGRPDPIDVGLASDLDSIQARNGIRLAPLLVRDWPEADTWSDDQLRALVARDGGSSIPIPGASSDPSGPASSRPNAPAAAHAFYALLSPTGTLAVFKVDKIWGSPLRLVQTTVRARTD